MIVCTVFLACVQDFITIIFGEKFLLSWVTLIILSITMVVTLFNVSIISVQNALGLHRIDSKYMVLQALLSILFGFILCLHFKMEGLFIGFLIPTFFFTFYLKGYLITKNVYGWNNIDYILFVSIQVIKLLLVVTPSVLISFIFSFNNLWFDFVLILFNFIKIANKRFKQFIHFFIIPCKVCKLIFSRLFRR